MVEHAETFLSLFAVDMDAALEVQPPDTWDSFPLFQLINDSLRSDCMYFGFWSFLFQWAAQVTDNAFSLSLLHREHTENWDGQRFTDLQTLSASAWFYSIATSKKHTP